MSSDSENENAPTIEQQYQKATQLEHILKRPDSYVGSIKTETKTQWVYDDDKNIMVEKTFLYNPALFKIFDEILVNASDNKVRDKSMSSIRIDIDGPSNMIRIWNNGTGVPIVEHEEYKVLVPTMIFGQLLTSTNYNDDNKKVVGGRNGYGAKLCNIFSTKFIVETSSKKYAKSFKQTWTDNMHNVDDPILAKNEKEDFTRITFYPDLARFGMEELDKDNIAVFCRRAYDIAACSSGITVHLNGKLLPVRSFKDYAELYTKGCEEEPKIVYEKFSDRWEVAMTTSVNETFTQVSFVNSIATTKGGTHVNYLTDQATARLLEIAKKKVKKDSKLKPSHVKNNLWVFVRCLVENPSFDSQTKENMTLQAKDFGSTCVLSDQFILKLAKCGIIEKVTAWSMFQEQNMLNKKCSKTKQTTLKDIPKLDDANCAGGKRSMECRLFLTEGDSAKTLAVSGIGVVGRDLHGVFPLKGKMLNARDATAKQITDNAEITYILKILGLKYQEKYETLESLKSLRYGKLVLMTDQDQDGSHIKGLAINFIHSKWPNLLKHNYIEQFITPIVKVFRNKNEISFYSIPEFHEWETTTPDSDKWSKKYYKGLGTSTSKEAKEYFSDMERHLIKFKHSGPSDEDNIIMAFSKDKTEARKEWLTEHMVKTKERREIGLEEEYLYGKGTKTVSYSEFIRKDLVLFSNTDNSRSIPCLVDGFKPGQRKVIFASIKRNLVRELKVAQLAGSVAELSAYHHGEASLMSTIINLAQDYVGSNNINLLMPGGQFGTRLTGGKDSASPRYIFTKLNKITKMIFHPHDDAILKTLTDDNQRIEPEWYAPIIPMILVNGCDGIGTGWSSKIPNFNPLDIINNVRNFINGKDTVKMHPWYRGFKGTIKEIDANRYQIFGEIARLGGKSVEITELPIRTWTSPYKESVMEVYRHGSEKTAATITDYKDHSTDTTVRFVVDLSDAGLAEAETVGFHKFFKLTSQLTLSNMILFDEHGVIKKYESASDILKSFCQVRMTIYDKRKAYLLGMLEAEASKLMNQVNFIQEKIRGTIVCENVKLAKIVETLIAKNYDSDPVKKWKNNVESTFPNENEADGTEEPHDPSKPDYDYLLCMRMVDLSEEHKDKLLALRNAKQNELETTRNKSLKQFWLEDLDILEKEYMELDKKEILNNEDEPSKNTVNKVTKQKKGGKLVKVNAETAPNKFAVRIEPKVEEETIRKLMADKEKKIAKKNMEDFCKKKPKSQPDIMDTNENGAVLDTNEDEAILETNEDEPLSLAERLLLKGKVQPQALSDITKKAVNKAKIVPKKSPVQKRKKPEFSSDSDDYDVTATKQRTTNGTESSVGDISGSFKQLVKPVQSTLNGFVTKTDAAKPKTERKLLPKEKKSPTKKAQAGKIVKPKVTKPKETKPKETKTKETKPKEVKKPVVPNKKLKISDDEESETDVIMTKSKPRRQVVQKKYIMSDSEDDNNANGSDDDFDVNEHKTKKAMVFDSDSD